MNKCQNKNCNNETEIYEGKPNNFCKGCYLYYKKNGELPTIEPIQDDVKPTLKPQNEEIKKNKYFPSTDQLIRLGISIFNTVYKGSKSKQRITEELKFYYNEIIKNVKGD